MAFRACIVIPSSRSDFCSPLTPPWFGSGTGTTMRRCGTRCARSSRPTYKGQWLDRDELSGFHLRFEQRLYGDEMFLLEPGTAIFPNFHSYIKPKAMHAYDPSGLINSAS